VRAYAGTVTAALVEEVESMRVCVKDALADRDAAVNESERFKQELALVRVLPRRLH
jgi:hypothetical protein